MLPEIHKKSTLPVKSLTSNSERSIVSGTSVITISSAFKKGKCIIMRKGKNDCVKGKGEEEIALGITSPRYKNIDGSTFLDSVSKYYTSGHKTVRNASTNRSCSSYQSHARLIDKEECSENCSSGFIPGQRDDSKDIFPHKGSPRYFEKPSNYRTPSIRSQHEPYEILILLMHIPTRRFEAVHLTYDPDIATIRDLLAAVPDKCTDPSLKNQRLRGLCCPRDGVELTRLQSLAAGICGDGCRLRPGELVLALPVEYTGEEVTLVFRKKLSKHPKLKSLLPYQKYSQNKQKYTLKLGDIRSESSETAKEKEGTITPSYSPVRGIPRHCNRTPVKTRLSPMVTSKIEQLSQNCDSVITVVDSSKGGVETTHIYSLDRKCPEEKISQSFKIFGSFLVILLQQYVFGASSGATSEASPMGVQGLILCAYFFKMFFQYQKDDIEKKGGGELELSRRLDYG